MKTLFRSVSFLFMFVLCVGFTGLAHAYTYDGPIDPADFMNEVEYTCVPLKLINENLGLVKCEKADLVAEVLVYRTMNGKIYIVGYGFKINDVYHKYMLDVETGNYKQVEP